MRVDGAVEDRDLALADVAASAGRGFFVEIGEQRLAPAARRLAQHGERGEAVVLDAAALVVDVLFVDLPAAEAPCRRAP